jgi:TolB protein
MVFVSFDKTVASGDHPENRHVTLRLKNMQTGVVTTIAKIFGGQGTINVPSWSADSRYFAFVSYQLVPQ